MGNVSLNDGLGLTLQRGGVLFRSAASHSQAKRAAVAMIDEWLDSRALRAQMPAFRLFGPAGSGKTTLARAVVERHDGALVAAFAGKAAHVLGQKVGREARTLHSAIWPDE